jgi:hypothetical protein
VKTKQHCVNSGSESATLLQGACLSCKRNCVSPKHCSQEVAPKSRRDQKRPVSEAGKTVRWPSNLHKRSKWAIVDSRKVDALILDLAFFIDNLEKVVDPRQMAVTRDRA